MYRRTPSYNWPEIIPGWPTKLVKLQDSTRRICREKIEPLKMVASSSKSMTEEIIDAIKDKTYDSCVSNLTKTHCVNLKKFRRE